MRDHECFLIRSGLRHLICLQEKNEEMDAEILRRLQTPPFREAFLLLQTIPGIGQWAAASILAETGTDLSTFPTAEKMACWAGLCPGNRKSVETGKGSQTTTGNPYLRSTLVQSAWAAARKSGSIIPIEIS
jgi:transposase